eukprot:Plantae.Rhodophyta-Rhodochaete_pulchella.ctg77249.p2 GENE.Plantae.Rhodophyta-Rhodochaete_pulchella.ctg77249~~Plantae.Rhodophyta-Rhodochaete_pulchella.ctg77249.p2  ORF type:complete len:184 (-),score=24.01 Plantae.Rhodophyta-Rhodochaete_pulchella.ctg77249:485-982(-)
MQLPAKEHWIAAKSVLRYLKGVDTQGLVHEKHKEVMLDTFVDASFAQDHADRKSVTGWVTREVVWLRGLLDEMGYTQNRPTVIHDDNQAAIRIAEATEFHERSNHIGVKFHYIREKLQNCEIVLKYCPTDEMAADMLTKGVSAEALERAMTWIGMSSELGHKWEC